MDGEKCGEGNLTNMVEIADFPKNNETSSSVCISEVFDKAHDILGTNFIVLHIHLIKIIIYHRFCFKRFLR